MKINNIYFKISIAFFIVGFFVLANNSKATSLGKNLSGQILLNVEVNGEAWYIYPEDNKRYYLGRPADAFKIMRELGLGITEVDFQRLASADMEIEGDIELAKSLSGKIILQVEKNGEAWYIYPKDLKKYYLGRPADAFSIMRELSLGITQENLAKIHKPGLDESINKYSKYEHKTISTVNGDFSIDIIEIDLANPNLKIITNTANKERCEKNCSAQTLGKFVIDNNGFAGINGTYFCTSSSCEANYYFYPVYNSNLEVLINAGKTKDEPVIPTTSGLSSINNFCKSSLRSVLVSNSSSSDSSISPPSLQSEL